MALNIPTVTVRINPFWLKAFRIACDMRCAGLVCWLLRHPMFKVG